MYKGQEGVYKGQDGVMKGSKVKLAIFHIQEPSFTCRKENKKLASTHFANGHVAVTINNLISPNCPKQTIIISRLTVHNND